MTDKEGEINHDFLKSIFLNDMGIDPSQKSPGSSELNSMNVLGNYMLVDEIGGGASGRVFSAIHMDLHKKMALKVFNIGDHAPKYLVKRIKEEAIISASLKHPNLITVHDIGARGDHYYMAMDLVEGVTLDSWLSGSSASMDQILDVMEKISSAVSYLHSMELIHRDLKPTNIMINNHGEPILVDFGLAQDLSGDQIDQEGLLIGTPRYMAPEQLKGETHLVDNRTDLFALGAILYELIFQAPPFKGNTPDKILEKIADQSFLPFQKNLLGNLEGVIRKSLEYDPDLRYQRCEDFSDDLKRIKNGGLASFVNATFPMRIDSLWRKIRLRPKVAILTSFLVFAFLTIGVTMWRQSQEKDEIHNALSIEAAYTAMTQRMRSLIDKAENRNSIALFDDKDTENILNEIETIFTSIPDSTGTADSFRFYLYSLLGKNEESIAKYNKVIAEFPNNPIIHRLEARLHLRRIARKFPFPGEDGVIFGLKLKVSETFKNSMGNNLREILDCACASMDKAKDIYGANAAYTVEKIYQDLSQAYRNIQNHKMAQASKALESLKGSGGLCLEIYSPLVLTYIYQDEVLKAKEVCELWISEAPNQDLARLSLGLCKCWLGLSMYGKSHEEGFKHLDSGIEDISRLPDCIDKYKKLSSLKLFATQLTNDYAKKQELAASTVNLITKLIKMNKADYKDYSNRAVAHSNMKDKIEDSWEAHESIKQRKKNKSLILLAINDCKKALELAPGKSHRINLQQNLVAELLNYLDVDCVTGKLPQKYSEEAVKEIQVLKNEIDACQEPGLKKSFMVILYYSMASLESTLGKYELYRVGFTNEKSLNHYRNSREHLEKALKDAPHHPALVGMKNYVDGILKKNE